ncbi:putative F-box protein At3g16210 [Prosopis cineraria]|uniref:putative F-box protein At3g16210 n=1 Tax=Prosopis cineraria TaxID=364024 RepID=UPI002410A57A|nr:putative F-box protein At3g16210 [Prosopis cineraria]
MLRNPVEPSTVKLKRTGMDRDMPFLPEEIIRNILIRLPVKSLTRFQCVCNHWKNLIKTPTFIADHLQHSRLQNPSLLLEWSGSIPLPGRLRSLDCEMQVREVQNAPLIDSLEGACIVSSCNGLLCIEIDECSKPPSLLLWNPATTEVRRVPRNRNDFIEFDYFVVGFGFSPIVNDYKIVTTYVEFGDEVNGVEVFSLSRGSWEGRDIGNLKGVTLDPETVTANGAIFWFGWLKLGAEGEGVVKMIVSFDIAKEVFTLIPMPDLNHDAAFERLTFYENKLAVLCGIWEDDDKDDDDDDDDDDEISELIDLWVLDEGTCESGERWSWNTRYASSPFSCILYPEAIWRDEIVCQRSSLGDIEEGGCSLYLMNLTTNEVKSFVFPDYVHGIYNYVESLVSVGDNCIEES